MKNISKRGLGIAAAIAIAASVAAIPAANAGRSSDKSDVNSVDGKITTSVDGASTEFKFSDVEGVRNEADGKIRIRRGGFTAYASPLCITATKSGGGQTAAVGFWVHSSNFPADSDVARGEFGFVYAQEKSGPDAARFEERDDNLLCRGQNFPAGVVLTNGSGKVDVKVK